jgi:hypothetical protein
VVGVHKTLLNDCRRRCTDADEVHERESLLDDDELGPLVLLGSKDFLDLFLLVDHAA